MAHHFSLAEGRALIADIGGGNLELIGAVAGLIEMSVSLPMGAVRLTEEWLSGERPMPRRVDRSMRRVRKRLKRRSTGRTGRPPRSSARGGTFTNLARMARARRAGEIRRRRSRPAK
ncbi:MAG: hypothetical protein R2882_10310 [Gemmatimonadales bacterium]